LPPQGLAQVLRNLPTLHDPNLLVGIETHDDAGVYRLSDEVALVSTIDFFPPVVNDPYIYGQIAAANALSDVYAMGGKPLTALNLVGYPDDKDPGLTWLADILRGGTERCHAAGCLVVGGHTVRDSEIKFGYAVTGLVHPAQVWTNTGAKAGDKLVLTKALGTGFVTTAHRRGDCPEDLFKIACESMVQLNSVGRDAALEVGGVHAATDVTGFGLAGHAYGMAEGSKVSLVIQVSRLPVFPGAEAIARKPYLTRASATNAGYVAAGLRTEGKPDATRLEFFYDAQTSGGLLLSVAAEKAEALAAAARAKGAAATAIIGEVSDRTDAALILRE
jgi:selenide, water dikinase